jgi:putative DNA primase/helicase
MNMVISEIGSAHAPWVSAGIDVFPCDPVDKHPLVKWKSPPEDGWGAAWRRHPRAMAGLDCGLHAIVVVDCDCKNGIDGEGGFRALADMIGVDLSEVPSVRTPSGGVHFYFAAPSGSAIRNSASRLAPGVDIRGAGGFVVVPGSLNAARKQYLPENIALPHFIDRVATRRLPPFPPALAIRITVGNANEELVAGVRSSWSLADARVRLAAAGPGTRNDTLNREAYTAGLRIVAGAAREDTVREQLAAAAMTTGLDGEEIERTIDGAITRAATAAVPVAVTDADLFGRPGAKGIKPSLRNARLAVEGLGIVARRDIFVDEIRISNAEGFETLASDHCGRLSDPALVFVRGLVQRRFGFDPGKEHLFDAICELAEDARFNPVAEWLDGLAWDGTRRLLSWLPDITGVAFGPLYGRAGVSLLLGMVARARYPGTKFDLCLVLEGAQGIGKSALAKALCSGPGDTYHTDVPGLVAMQPKEKGETLAGKWVVELAELSGLTKSDVESVKGFLSQSSDRYRVAYGRVARDQQRTSVFIATTNACEYLMDRSGNRRFLPVPCSKVDLVGFRRDRDQLFAEADHLLRILVNEHDSSHVQPGKPLPEDLAAKIGLPKSVWQEAAAVVDGRLVTDAVEEAVQTLIEAHTLPIRTMPDGRRCIMTGDLHDALRTRGITASTKSLPDIMSRLGWDREQIGPKNARRRGFAERSG